MKAIQILFVLIASLAIGCNDDDTLVNTSSNSLVDIVSQEQFNTEVSDGVSLIFYHASWCTKCAAQRPAVESVSENQAFTDVFFAEVEYEDFSLLVKDRNIQGFPTVVIYKDNVEQKRFSGQGHPEMDISEALKEVLD